MSKEISFEIKRQVGVITENPAGWDKELNLVSWNGNDEKYDIRDWDKEHTKMSKGITLTEGQQKLCTNF